MEQLYCEDCGQKAQPGDLLCRDCGGALVKHQLQVPEVGPQGRSAGDVMDLDSLLAQIEPTGAGATEENLPPSAVFEPEESPAAPAGDLDLDDLLGPAAQPPVAASPAAGAPAAGDLNLDDLLGAAPAAPAAGEPLDLDSLLAAPGPAAAAAPAPAGDVDLDDLLGAAPAAAPAGQPAAAGDLNLDDLLGAAPAGGAAAAGTGLDDLDELLGMPARSQPAAAPPPIGRVDVDIAGLVTRYDIEGEVLDIGRIDPGVHKPAIDLSRDDAVSRHHAELRVREGKVFLVDVGSTNGTSLNGTRCDPQKEYQLADGDTITAGEKCVITVHLS